MSEMSIKSHIHTYKVFFESDFTFLEKLKKIEHKVIVIDKKVFLLYQELFAQFERDSIFLLDALEENKTLNSVQEIYRFFAGLSTKRNTTLVSIGGGIVQDVTGFVASTLYRGIRWIFVPTTFLAQADSCIGSKTSLNFEKYKNIIGGFYPPHEIYIQPDFLNTLERKDYFSGLGEVIKFQLLKEQYPKDIDSIIKLVEDLKAGRNRLEAIKKTMEIKRTYIDEDEFDTGKRLLFNYGHCFGHALENASRYEVPHGIAVTIGMIFANIVSIGRGLISANIFDTLNQRLFLPNIFISLRKELFDRDVLLISMQNDKKRVSNLLTIVIPSNDGIVAKKMDDMSDEEFFRSYEQLMDILGINS